jgi:hypothetical protein
MQDPILKELHRIRAQMLKELKRDPERAIAEWNERSLKACEVVISPTGERQLVGSMQKQYDVYIAPRLRRKHARARARKAEKELRG